MEENTFMGIMIKRILFPLFLYLTFYGCSFAASSSRSTYGVVLIKPHAWSASSEVSDAAFFERFVDHTKYYSFWEGDQERQVTKVRIVEMLPIPSPGDFPTIVSESDIQRLKLHATKLKNAFDKFPTRLKSLQPRLLALHSEVARFENGQKKIEGVWYSNQDYLRKQGEQAAVAARDAENAKLAQARELANQAQTELESRVAGLRAQLQSSQNIDSAVSVIAKLEHAASKNKIPDLAELILAWKKDYASSSQLKSEIHQFLRQQLREASALFVEAQTLGNVKPLPAQVITQAQAMLLKVTEFQDDKRFPIIKENVLMETKPIDYLVTLSNLGSLVESGNLATAGKTVAALKLPSIIVDNEHQPILLSLQSYKLCIERALNVAAENVRVADLLAAHGKTSEAIKLYETANVTLQSVELANKIKKLREDSLGL